MPRVVHFEIHADNPERASTFYKDIFGWEFTKWEGSEEYWMIKTGEEGTPGINGGLVKRQTPVTNDGIIAYVCTMDVESVDNYIGKITSNGGSIAKPKVAIPGMGWLVYCKDTEGNMFGMMQPDKNAK